MPLIVLKFGGTSVGSCDKIIKVAKLVKQYYDQKNKVIVVSSAMSGATDDLIKKSKNGSIINISSTAGILGFPLRTPYAASKWAIVGMTKSLAMELGKYNIRVNAICPGTIKGDRMKRVIRDKAKFEKVSAKTIENDFVSMASMRSWINPEDIGNMCAHLISDEANKVSGQVIAVDGNCERMD